MNPRREKTLLDDRVVGSDHNRTRLDISLSGLIAYGPPPVISVTGDRS